MFNHLLNTLKSVAISGLITASVAVFPAYAESPFGPSEDETFDNATVVSDAELATMRGGFMNINGIMIDFSFLSRVQVGLDTVNNVSLSTSSLAEAALTASQIQELIQPQVVQNIDDNTLISIQQALNLNLVNANQLNVLSQAVQHNFQQAMDAQ